MNVYVSKLSMYVYSYVALIPYLDVCSCVAITCICTLMMYAITLLFYNIILLITRGCLSVPQANSSFKHINMRTMPMHNTPTFIIEVYCLAT